jgi:hypothetical protein
MWNRGAFQCQYSTCTLHFLSKRTSYDAMADLSITRFLDLNIYKQSEKRTYFVCLHHANSVNSMSEQSSQGSLKNIDETVIKLNINVIVAPTAFSNQSSLLCMTAYFHYGLHEKCLIYKTWKRYSTFIVLHIYSMQ